MAAKNAKLERQFHVRIAGTGQSSFAIGMKADRPNLRGAGGGGRFVPTLLPAFQAGRCRTASSNCECPIAFPRPALTEAEARGVWLLVPFADYLLWATATRDADNWRTTRLRTFASSIGFSRGRSVCSERPLGPMIVSFSRRAVSSTERQFALAARYALRTHGHIPDCHRNRRHPGLTGAIRSPRFPRTRRKGCRRTMWR